MAEVLLAGINDGRFQQPRRTRAISKRPGAAIRLSEVAAIWDTLSGRPDTCGDVDAKAATAWARSAGKPAVTELADERRSRPVVHSAPRLDGGLWAVNAPRRIDRPVDLPGHPASDRDAAADDVHLARFVSLSARLAWHVYHAHRSLNDPVSQLAGRTEFETFLKRALAAAHANAYPLDVLLVYPDDFVMVNHRRFAGSAGHQHAQ